MLESLVDDVLELIARRTVRAGVEIDDCARTAAALALTSRRVSKVMSGVAWKAVSDAAALMDPSPVGQALRSHCDPKTARKKDIAAVAEAAKLRKSMTLAQMEDALDRNDDLVGTACPIPIAAAAYIVRMSFRWMPPTIARAKFGDRDFTACEMRAGMLRFRDLRAAPVRAPPPQVDRAPELAFLDALFTPAKPRPWWVRTMRDADTYFRREKLVAAGYPVGAAEWRVTESELRGFKEVCELLGAKMANFSSTYGPTWGSLRHRALESVPRVFSLCRDLLPFSAPFTVADVQRVRAETDAAFDTLAAVPPGVLDECYAIMRSWLPAKATVSVAAATVLLRHSGLPTAPAWWILGPGDDLHELAAQARSIAFALDVAVEYSVEAFAMVVATAVRDATGAEAPRPENGLFLTEREYRRMLTIK